MTKKTARLHVQRGAPGAALRTETFDVPFEPGNSVLDGLRWIRATLDPTLAVRFSCTLKIYGLFQAFLSVPRAVWGNFINFLATARALLIFCRAVRKGGEPIPWEKTDHEFPASV